MKIWGNSDFEGPVKWISESTEAEVHSAERGRNRISEFLDLDVVPALKGLQVLRIGEKSPFCRLTPLGGFTMQGLVESNDRIIAIDGVVLNQASDLTNLTHQRSTCEVTIFDHRTRLTVSWQIHLREWIASA